MKFRTAEKCSLFPENVMDKNRRNVGNVEVQLLGDDNLDLMDKLNSKIVSIHLPLPPFCNISNILEAVRNKNSDYDYLLKIIEKCKKYSCGMVIHADITLERYYRMDKEGILIEFFRKNNVVIHIENTVEEIGNGTDSVVAPIQICNYINQKIGKKLCFPLLDICHFQMVQNDFERSLKYNLKETLKMYNSDKYYLHLCNSVGCGDDKFGGMHGSNFKYDLPLLEKILNVLKYYHPMLVLEVREKDYSDPINVIELEGFIKNVEKILPIVK